MTYEERALVGAYTNLNVASKAIEQSIRLASVINDALLNHYFLNIQEGMQKAYDLFYRMVNSKMEGELSEETNEKV